MRFRAPKPGTIWLHARTKNYYVVTGLCQLDATNKPAVLYLPMDGSGGRPWARDVDEFLDGRFLNIVPFRFEDAAQSEPRRTQERFAQVHANEVRKFQYVVRDQESMQEIIDAEENREG